MKFEKNKLYLFNLYKHIDGFYNSYWIGKFINNFIKSGNKLTIEKELKKSLLFFKLNQKHYFIVLFLECLENIKPMFKMASTMKGGKLKEFPVLLNKYKQRIFAIKNLKNLIKYRKEWFLGQRILNEIIDFKAHKATHHLIKQRDDNLKTASKNRFNIRLSKKRKW